MVIRTIAGAALLLSHILAEPALASETIAPPAAMKSCPPEDPVATAEARLATRLGGDFLGCFQSGSSVDTNMTAQQTSTTTQYAFALALHDRTYSVADLQELLSKVKQQWRDFEPLSGNLPDAYAAKLNGLIKDQGERGAASVKSVRPTLVKIDETHAGYYSVVSVRTYVVATGGVSVIATKVNADAVMVRNSKLFRLTIQRTLTEPADVARAEVEIDLWAKSIVSS